MTAPDKVAEHTNICIIIFKKNTDKKIDNKKFGNYLFLDKPFHIHDWYLVVFQP